MTTLTQTYPAFAILAFAAVVAAEIVLAPVLVAGARWVARRFPSVAASLAVVAVTVPAALIGGVL